MNFTINKFEKIAIIGEKSSGKSSLFYGIIRLIEPFSGEIYIDNIDISKICLNKLRKNVFIIPENPYLITGSLRINLDPFNEFNDLEIVNCLKKIEI